MASEDKLFVSIIIPTYNREIRIKNCLDKLLETTFDLNQVEVIVVDDLSTDNTRVVVETYQNKFPNFFFIKREKNSGGASEPRNDGLNIASGEWILFIDSDDYITENALSDAFSLSQKDKTIDMVCMPYFRGDGGKRPISASAFSYTKDVWGLDFTETKLYNTLNVIGKLIKRDLIEENNLRFPAGIRVREDNWFLMKAYSVARNIAILGNQKHYYFYEEVDEVALSTTGTPPRDAVKIYLSTYDFIMNHPEIDDEKKIDLLTLFLNRYAKMIQRGKEAPIRLYKRIKDVMPKVLANRFISEETNSFLLELERETGTVEKNMNQVNRRSSKEEVVLSNAGQLSSAGLVEESGVKSAIKKESSSMDSGVRQYIESIYPGEWVNENLDMDSLKIRRVAYALSELESDSNCWIAMSSETFYRGSQNTRIYRNWADTHDVILKDLDKVSLMIVERPIEAPGAEKIAQYLVDDSYEFLKAMSEKNRSTFKGKMIAITGTVGKSSSKELLDLALNEYDNAYASKTNFNTRTGIRVNFASLLPGLNYDYCILEVAISALWYGESGIAPEVRSDYTLFTQFGNGQWGSDSKKAIRYKSRLASHMSEEGEVILNRDTDDYAHAYEVISQEQPNIFDFSTENHAYTQLHGFDEIDDASFLMKVGVGGEVFEFKVPFVYRYDPGFVSNVLGTITILDRLGKDLGKYRNTFSEFRRRNHLLNFIESKIGERRITLIDDTYSAEELSMINAMKFIKQIGSRYTGKRYAILGHIINLDDLEEQVYSNLAKELEINEFDKVFTYGDGVDHLQRSLPPELQGGHFHTLSDFQQRGLPKIEDDSLVLLKGDWKGSNLRDFVKLFKNPDLNIIDEKQMGYGYIDSNGEISISQQNYSEYTAGVANLLIVHEVLYRVQTGFAFWDDFVYFDSYSSEPKADRSTGALENEVRYLIDVFHQAIFLNAPDAILALGIYLYGDEKTALNVLQEKAEKNGISPEAVRNLSGRPARSRGQKIKLRDIGEAAKLFIEIDPELLMEIRNKNLLINGKPSEALNKYDRIMKNKASIIWGNDLQFGVIIDFSSEHTTVAFGICPDSNYRLKEVLLGCLQNEGGDFSAIPVKKMKEIETSRITILGDVYFGEWYTNKRKLRGIDDAIQRYGYHYSFDKIGRLIRPDSFNIINFEAAIPEKLGKDSPLKGVKPFVLGADKIPTLAELKSRNVDAVTIATNHTFDYGRNEVVNTVESFYEGGMIPMGAGSDAIEASSPMSIKYGDQVITIFNGYWYRRPGEKKFQAYAAGGLPGVANLTGLLLERIRSHRRTNPDDMIWVIAHWGVDYKPVDEYQRKAAYDLIHAGADLIIGHGPHYVQPVEYVLGKPVIYSLGNGVFNANGDFSRHGIPSYGLFLSIDIEKSVIDFYPIFTNNLVSFWQPFVLQENEHIEEFKKLDLGVLLDSPLDKDSEGAYRFRFKF